MIQLVAPSAQSIQTLGEALRRGELVAMPTETVYGLAGSALSASAVARIFQAKERPTFDPLIVHVRTFAPDQDAIDGLDRMHIIEKSLMSEAALKRARLLARKFWPGPLTLVLPRSSQIPDLVTSGLPTVAVRVPNHPLTQELLKASGLPLAAPSANRFGRISPTSAQAVVEELRDRIPWVLDGGKCQVGLESTIVQVLENGAVQILRAGGTPREAIEEILGDSVTIRSSGAILAPGMLESHYAPRKKLILLSDAVSSMKGIETMPALSRDARVGLLAFSGEEKKLASRFAKLSGHDTIVRVLSPSGSIEESAQRLFSCLRELDSSEASIIFSEPSPSLVGLGYAIADRLERASA